MDIKIRNIVREIIETCSESDAKFAMWISKRKLEEFLEKYTKEIQR